MIQVQNPLPLVSGWRDRLFSRNQTPPDVVLIAIVMLLVVIGVMSIYSVSVGPNLQDGRDDPFGLVERHLLLLGLGAAVMLIGALIDYHLLVRFSVPLMVGTLIALVLLLIFGHEEQGARRWLIGPSVQPGELAKLATIIYVAAWLASKGKKLSNPVYGLVPFAILVGLVAGLIWLQPNYSTAVLIATTAFAMFFIAGADLKQFFGAAIFGGAAATLIITQSARAMERFNLLLVEPTGELTNQSWQLAQTLMALASGGTFGKGLGTGGGQYGYVPLAHSDGIFAIWGEETGLIGSYILVAVFLALAWRGYRIAQGAPDLFGKVLAAGVTTWLILQAFVNMGVVTQLIPFTGQPLPFISFGGSSLVTVLAGVGLLLSVSRGKPVSPAPKRVGRSPSATKTPGTMKENHATLGYRGRNGGARLPAGRGPDKPRRQPRAGTDE